MPRAELDQQIQRLIRHYDKFFVNYGGAQANIPERMYWVNQDWINPIVQRDYHKSPGDHQKGLSPGESLHHMNKHLEQFIEHRGKAHTAEVKLLFNDPEFTEEKLEMFIREYVAKMEYALWEGTKLDPIQVVRDMVIRSPDTNVPYINYIGVVRGTHSRTYRNLLPETYRSR